MSRSEARRRWQGIFAEHARSGLSVAEFCRQQNLSQVSFYQWRRKLRAAAEMPASFVPVAITGTAAVSVELPCGAIVRVPPGDDQSLTRILALLLASPERHR